jgi:hypothetical protein
MSPFVDVLRIFVPQGEMQQLRDKLAIAERAARSEAQLKVHIHYLCFLRSLFISLFYQLGLPLSLDS